MRSPQLRLPLAVAFVASALVASPSGAHARGTRDYGGELRLARELSLEGGKIALDFLGKVDVEHKDGGEVVTAADRAVSAHIVSRIRAAFPNDLVITEEDKSNWSRLRFARRVWFVDPIDGTADYVKQADGFAVQIGLVEKWPVFGKGRAIVGAVFQPKSDRLYLAAPGYGARLIEHGVERRLHTSNRRDPAQLRLIVSDSNRNESTDAVKAALGIRDEVGIGSVGVKLGLIARGEHDLTFKANSRAKVWDIAAPQAILEAAGGRFTDMRGRRFDYGRIATAGGILATNGVAHDAVVARARAVLRTLATKR